MIGIIWIKMQYLRKYYYRISRFPYMAFPLLNLQSDILTASYRNELGE